MFRTFLVSQRLKNAYRINGVIFSLKSFPLIKHILPDEAYASKGLKIFGGIISALMEVGSVFLPKALYLYGVYLAVHQMPVNPASASVHILFFLSIVGALVNTKVFSPSKDKFYGIVLMRMDARKFVLSNYLYEMMKTAVGMMLASLVFGRMSGIPDSLSLLLPFYIISVKTIYAAFKLYVFRHQFNLKAAEKITLAVSAVLLAASFLPVYLGYAADLNIYLYLECLFLLLSLPAWWYLFCFDQYLDFSRRILTPENMIASSTLTAGQVMQESMRKNISGGAEITSSRHGYAYLNDLFVKRHQRILLRSSKIIAAIELAVFICAAASCYLFPSVKEVINKILLSSMPALLFLMYMTNRGETVTRSLFMNCDCSMLSYRFYRQPKAILSLFKCRLLSLIWIDLVQASVMAAGLPILLWVSGGTEQILNYLLLFTTVISLSIFFSVHNLVLYYLLQPYNTELQTKSMTYVAARATTYVVCYSAVGKHVSTLFFGTAVSVFCILYALTACLLAYRYAPKTFKMR